MENDDTENMLLIRLATGQVLIDLFPEVAPLHVERVKELARAGEYDNVAFHRVLDGFVAQTGDVQYGDLEDGYNPFLVGTGGSDLPDLPPEFSDIPFERGIVGMARAQALDSANSQFFIMFEEESFLNGQYTAFGEVVLGMELVDQIKRGAPPTGLVSDPDRMIEVDVYADLFGLGLDVEEAREIALLYEAGLDRDGDIDLPGLNFWIDAREAGLSKRGLAAEFLNSEEFQASAEAFLGDGTDLTDETVRDQLVFSDEDYVSLLYENVLERTPDAGGLAFWLGILEGFADNPGEADTARERLLLAFAQSEENVAGSPAIETMTEIAPGDWAFA